MRIPRCKNIANLLNLCWMAWKVVGLLKETDYSPLEKNAIEYKSTSYGCPNGNQELLIYMFFFFRTYQTPCRGGTDHHWKPMNIEW